MPTTAEVTFRMQVREPGRLIQELERSPFKTKYILETVGISRSFLYKLSDGRRNCDTEVAARLATVLGAKADDLFQPMVAVPSGHPIHAAVQLHRQRST